MNNSDSTAARQHWPYFRSTIVGNFALKPKASKCVASLENCLSGRLLSARPVFQTVSDGGHNFPWPHFLACLTAPHSAAFHT